jgi:hypothetical protein
VGFVEKLGKVDILQKLWEWADEKLTRGDVNNSM